MAHIADHRELFKTRQVIRRHDPASRIVDLPVTGTVRRLLMERCFAGSLRVVADTTPLSLAEWAGQYFYQTARL